MSATHPPCNPSVLSRCSEAESETFVSDLSGSLGNSMVSPAAGHQSARSARDASALPCGSRGEPAITVVSPRELRPGDEVLALGLRSDADALRELALAGLRAGVGIIVRGLVAHVGRPFVEVRLWPCIDAADTGRTLFIAETAVIVVAREGGPR